MELARATSNSIPDGPAGRDDPVTANHIFQGREQDLRWSGFGAVYGIWRSGGLTCGLCFLQVTRTQRVKQSLSSGKCGGNVRVPG